LGGQRESGDDVRNSNVTAAIAVANIVRSSLGPVGLDKMLVDEIGDVVITNDGATILRKLDVEHPAARLLVDLAQLQDQEVGDGTTSVVLMAAELLRLGNALIVTTHLHPTTVIAGYRIALKAAVAYLKQNLVVPVSTLSDNHLLQAARTSMSSKLIGDGGNTSGTGDAGSVDDFFAKLAVEAVKSVKMMQGGKEKYPLAAIHILKAHGKSWTDSQLLKNGFAIQAVRAAQGMPTQIQGTSVDGGDGLVKIAMLDMNLQRHRMGMGITVTVTDPAEVENIKKREMDITKEKIFKILATGCKVVLTTKGIDDICLKYFVEAGVLCARRCNKDDLKRLAKAVGGKVVTTLADMEGEESFDLAALGTCTAVQEVRIGDGEMLHFDGCCGGAGASTIVLRGANEYMLDEMDRALHDALCVVKRMLESNTLVPGGGAVEAALSVYLEDYALSQMDTREQLAIHEFAEAVMVIPKTLAVNAAKDSSELVAKLRAIHARSQKGERGTSSRTDEEDNYKNYGLDLVQGEIRDNLAAGVVEPAVSKIKSLRFATEAAITILRIDDRITVTKEQ
jgi:T-complex protein 1 subunit alpha